MGGYNLLQAFPNYLIYMRFIRRNTVCKVIVNQSWKWNAQLQLRNAAKQSCYVW